MNLLRPVSFDAARTPLARLLYRSYAQKIPSLPPIDEADIDETFVRGSGPGGQAINKLSISVSLLHKPTGIRVQCHQTRSREQNRSLARKILRERVDVHYNGGDSKRETKNRQEAARKAAKARKRKRKEKEGQDDVVAPTLADNEA